MRRKRSITGIFIQFFFQTDKALSVQINNDGNFKRKNIVDVWL